MTENRAVWVIEITHTYDGEILTDVFDDESLAVGAFVARVRNFTPSGPLEVQREKTGAVVAYDPGGDHLRLRRVEITVEEELRVDDPAAALDELMRDFPA